MKCSPRCDWLWHAPGCPNSRRRLRRSALLLLLAITCLGCATAGPDCVENCPEVPMSDHTRRLGMACRGEWKPEYQEGRKSPDKGIFECTHALKNWFVELFRKHCLWNRGDRDPDKCEGYLFPEPACGS